MAEAGIKTLDTEETPALDLKKKAKGGDYVRIVLEDNDDVPPNGLYLGHNGDGYIIQSGVEVDVPRKLLNILEDAVTSTPVIDPLTRQVTGWRRKLRFPYRLVT